ncbi:MAG: hypothetical protein AAF183_24200, partial [Pseudomonadota bacterium]
MARCIKEGLVGGEVFGVDASLIKADANREDGIAANDWSPAEHAGHSTLEYLVTLDDADFGAATQFQPKYLSPVDPSARWSAADRGKAHFTYSANDLVDLDNATIVVVEPTAPIRQAESKAARDMIERTRDRFDLYPGRLVGDTAYGDAKMLAWLVYEQGIEPHVPVIDKSRRKDQTFSRDALDEAGVRCVTNTHRLSLTTLRETTFSTKSAACEEAAISRMPVCGPWHSTSQRSR